MENGTLEASCQTEIVPVTLRAWLIQKGIPSGASGLESPSPAQLYVLETRSLGFSIGTQTPDGDLYGRDRSAMLELVASWRVLMIFLPSLLYFLLYFLNQLLDAVVCGQFCAADDWWWCGIGLTFLLVPSIFISLFAYEQLTVPDLPNVKPMKKTVAQSLCLFQLTPFYILGRRVTWCLKAWLWSDNRDEGFRNQSRDMWQRAAQQSDSSAVKLLQSLLESLPQLSLQSYVLLLKLEEATETAGSGPTFALWSSVFVNLLSVSSSMASSQTQTMFERMVGSIAIFVTLGSRVLVCGVVGSLNSAFWVVPLCASFVIGLVTKISESQESTLTGHVARAKKYALEALVAASVLPPFDVSGFFCSSVYVLAAFVFFMRSPSELIHIFAPILALAGQAMWLAFGFLLMKKPILPSPPQSPQSVQHIHL